MVGIIRRPMIRATLGLLIVEAVPGFVVSGMFENARFGRADGVLISIGMLMPRSNTMTFTGSASGS